MSAQPAFQWEFPAADELPSAIFNEASHGAEGSELTDRKVSRAKLLCFTACILDTLCDFIFYLQLVTANHVT